MTAIADATPDIITPETTETFACVWCKGTGTYEFTDPWIVADLGEKPGPRPCMGCTGTGTYAPAPVTDDTDWTDTSYEPDYEPDNHYYDDTDWTDTSYEPDYEPDNHYYDDPAEADRAADRYERWLDSLWS